MICLRAYKYRIYPNREQRGKLAVQFGHARFVYNYALNARKEHYRKTGKGLSYSATAKMLPGMKKELEWLREADSQVLQQKLRDLDRAYVNFFQIQRRLSRKKKGSANRSKMRLKVARLHEYVANQRKDFLDKLSHRLTTQYGSVGLGVS